MLTTRSEPTGTGGAMTMAMAEYNGWIRRDIPFHVSIATRAVKQMASLVYCKFVEGRDLVPIVDRFGANRPVWGKDDELRDGVAALRIDAGSPDPDCEFEILIYQDGDAIFEEVARGRSTWVFYPF